LIQFTGTLVVQPKRNISTAAKLTRTTAFIPSPDVWVRVIAIKVYASRAVATRCLEYKALGADLRLYQDAGRKTGH
jgi:hypothetical protein